MADDKKSIREAAPPAEAPAPAVENAAVPEQAAPEPVLTDAEAVMLEHEGQAALFEMGEAVPDPADAVTHAEVEEPAAPGKDDPAPAHSGKVVDFAAARNEAAKEEKKAIKQKPPKEKGKAAKPGKGRPPKTEKTAPEQTKPPKAGKTHAAPEEKAAPPAPEVPPTPRDATRGEKEEIVYLDLSDLHPFKDHPFGVRDDAEMKSLVESVRNGGVNQPALVRPREGGGYEIIAGHRRQMASQLAGYRNMPCIVRNMTDDEAILAMTDDNLRQRETILPSEKAMSLKMQYEAIKHQGARGDSAEAGKLSLESVGQRNGMSVKTVQRYWSMLAQKDEDKLLKRLLNVSDRERNSAKKKQAAELKKAEKRKAEVDGLFAKMYEDWSAGRITEYNFNMLSEKYQNEQKELETKIRQLHETMEAAVQTAADAEKWIALMKQYVNPVELTAELLNTLIEKITVHEAVKGEDGSREQEVEIYYRFIGKID